MLKLGKKWVSDGDEFEVRQHDGEIMLLKVVADPYPESPRGEEGQIGNMICWHRRYCLGDAHNYQEPSQFLAEMVREFVPGKALLSAAKQGRLNIRMKYNSSTKKWELLTPCCWNVLGANSEPEMYSEGSFSRAELETDWFMDVLIDNLSEGAMVSLLKESRDFFFLPLFLCDHSGITMSVSEYGDRWDSGQVGWIYTTKEAVMKNLFCFTRNPENPKRMTRVTETNWKEAACDALMGEVRLYDSYLTHEVYGYELHRMNEAGVPDEAAEESFFGFYGSDYAFNGILDDFEVVKESA